MTSIVDDVIAAIKNYYNYQAHSTFADTYAAQAGYNVPQGNAFAHAYVSAMITLEHTAAEALLLGDGREFVTTFDYYFRGGGDYRTDTFRDLYNNQVGIEIGKYCKANSLGQSDVISLVNQAIANGDCILSIDLSNPDPRIPPIDDKIFDLTGPGFNGWPFDFPNLPNTWTPPGGGSTGSTGSVQNATLLEYDDANFGVTTPDGGTLAGTSATDILVGDVGADNLSGSGGDDLISGQGGNDDLQGGEGEDVVLGDGGNDTLVGGVGATGQNYETWIDGVSDTLQGGAGSDTYNIAGYMYYLDVPPIPVDRDYNFYKNSLESIDIIHDTSGSDNLNVQYRFSSTSNWFSISYNGEWSGPVSRNDVLTWVSADGNSKEASLIEVTEDGVVHRYLVMSAVYPARDILFAIKDFENGNLGITLPDLPTAPDGDNTDDDNWQGGSGDDNMDTGAGTDTAYGMGGSDAMAGGADDDYLDGGSGNDTLEGGSGSDELMGQAGDDHIAGGDGADDLSGGDGSDILEGGSGDDVLDGGDGVDRATYANAAAAVTVNLATVTAQNTIGAGSDTLYGLENLTGSAFNDALTGTSSANVLAGLAGNDTLNGGDGDDVLDGGAGADTIVGGLGTDTVSYASATDDVYVHMGWLAQNLGDALGDTYDSIENVTASDFDDTIIATSGANVILGLSGDDALSGLEGDDTIYGDDGLDQIYGDQGNDQLYGGDGNDIVFGYEDNDTLIMGNGDDFGIGGEGDDTVDGGEGLDELHGHAGNDLLNGGTGADLLFGDEGNDRIILGSGDDFTLGGADNDTFVFSSQVGIDTIGDFSAGAGTSDMIELSGLGISSYTELQTYMSEWNGNTYIEFDQNNVIVLEGVTINSLSDDDFLFV